MKSIYLRVLLVASLVTGSASANAHQDAKGIQISTKSPKAHALFEKGMHQIEMLHLQDGVENLRGAAKADPKFALAHIFITFFSQDPAEQMAEREKAVAVRKYAGREEQLIIDWLANASQARWIPAIQAMNEALQSYPNDKHLQWLAGWWLALNQNQSPRALVLFERAIKLDPKFADPWNEAAYCYAKAGNFEKAFADIKRYTELVPNEPNPQDSFAELSRMAGRFDDALKHYRMSLKIDPTFHESQLGLGDTYALMGNQAKAREEYALAIKQGTPIQGATWSLQSAATYIREGDLAGADKAFRDAAQLAHSSDFANLEAEAYRTMAMYQSDSATALELLRKAETVLHEDHKVPQVLLNEEMAFVLRTRVERALHDGNQELADSALRQLADLAGSEADEVLQAAYHGASGAYTLAQRNYTEAIANFEEDLANPISLRGLAEAYEKSGQKENAERYAAKLAAFNIPIIEQAMVVPQFRIDRARKLAATK
jgi:tetratricopeptide (TPR) repeat protein